MIPSRHFEQTFRNLPHWCFVIHNITAGTCHSDSIMHIKLPTREHRKDGNYAKLFSQLANQNIAAIFLAKDEKFCIIPILPRFSPTDKRDKNFLAASIEGSKYNSIRGLYCFYTNGWPSHFSVGHCYSWWGEKKLKTLL